MRKLLLSAVAAVLIPASALAQTTYSPGQTGAVGTIVSAQDPSGNPRRVVLPHFICDGGCSSPAAWTPKLLNGLSNVITSVKGSAGTFGYVQCYNPNTSPVYIQVLDSAAPTLGTTAPVQSVPIAPGTTGGYAPPGGITFNNAIQVAATTTATGSTAPTTAPDCNAGFN